jgi:dehydrogenase/reductase SDR family protein 9
VAATITTENDGTEYKGLFAIINNAGILAGSVAEWSRQHGLRKEFEVNFFGVVNVTLELLPLLRVYGKGARVVTIASIDADFRMFGFSGYGASKSAIAHYMDILRLELAPCKCTDCCL